MTPWALAHGWMADLSQAATGSLVAAVWQGMLLAAAAWLGLRLLPKTPAAVRFAIWFGVFLVVTALPVIALWSHGSVAEAAVGHGPWVTVDVRWSLAIAGVWAIASMIRAGTLVLAGFRVRALWKRARPVEIDGVSGLHPTHRDETAMNGAPGVFGAQKNVPQGLKPDAAASVYGTAEAVPLSKTGWDGAWSLKKTVRRAQVCTSDEVDRPTVIGFFSPKILIPEWLLGKLTPAELEQIVLHESGHLGRADDWMNLLQKIALVVFPLNPALAWVERRLCFERELACDERVLQATGAPKAYAACLATLAEYRLGRRGLALALGALGRESELGQRVRRILRRGEGMRPLHAKLVLGGAMLGLLGAAAGLERCPQLVGFSAERSEQAKAISPASGYSYQPVVFHGEALRDQAWKSIGDAAPVTRKAYSSKHIQQQSHAIGEDNGQTLTAGEQIAVSVEPVATKRLVKDDVSLPARVVRTGAQQMRQSQRDVVVTQWVVVQSWQVEDGSRVVLTTAGTSRDTPKAQSAMQRVPAEDFLPYAAVPVRGGWLVFQL
jgi:hypothetical protein